MSNRLFRRAAVAVAVALLVYAWVIVISGPFQVDARAYWSVDLDDPYASSLVGRAGTFLYSPVFAQVIWPLTFLPWPIFAGLWAGLNLSALVWMVGPIPAALLVYIPFSPVRDELTTGNIHLLLAAAIVLGLRLAIWWAFPILSKVTPGVGVLWFLGSRQWRDLAVAVAATGMICIASFLLSPQAWREWVALLMQSASVAVPSEIGVIPGPLALRVALAAVAVIAGGALGWRLTVPVAATLALPVTWSSGLSILVALVPLYRQQLAEWWSQVVGHVRNRRTSFASR